MRLNRNATETRIHSLWNHLVETASRQTGSLLIWDTGTFTVLPRRTKHSPSKDPSSPAASSSSQDVDGEKITQQHLLEQAFRDRKIRLRLHGFKLPNPYVLNIRLTKSEDAHGRATSTTPKRRPRARPKAVDPETSPSEEDEQPTHSEEESHLVSREEDDGQASATDREIREIEDDQVRRTNAYPGASNSIGSIHRRKWYLSLDREACGFVKRKEQGKRRWELANAEPLAASRKRAEGDNRFNQRLSFPFYVRGVEHETSKRGDWSERRRCHAG